MQRSNNLSCAARNVHCGDNHEHDHHQKQHAILLKDEGLTMKSDPEIESVRNESIWAATSKMPTYSPLREDIEADVCIVGAGIAGLTTAYLLTQAGKSVVILDDGPLAGGATEVTTAHLSNALDDRYFMIERLHGREGARLAAESHTAAIDRIEEIVKKEQIDCDFERLDGYLFLGPGEKEELLDRELAAAHRAGLNQVEKLMRAPLHSFDTGPCLYFPSQAQFHPLKYLAALTMTIELAGGRLFTNSPVDQIDGGPKARIKVGSHVVTASAVVVATNTPINDVLVIHTKQSAFMTYVIGARVPRDSVARGLYWDTLDPYHYIRLQRLNSGGTIENGQHDYDLLIVGGEDHKTGQAEDMQERHARLETWARQRFPMMETVEFTWAGQCMVTLDGLAFIGRNPLDRDNVYVVTGDCGLGMTHGTIAGILLTDLIRGEENPWATLYDPSRKTLSATPEFIQKVINLVDQYADWATGGDVSTVDEIGNDSGAVLRDGLTKVAVYRDEKGELHERSAICPHLGCIVVWNPTEKTWDCPCHGSRFDKFGKFINGPANRELFPSSSLKP
jgi:glycine/D-amino acid oxidase-like deaminating enzyme/nitrite reductase/ring-hydroxylating ferredoxin subunit